MSSESTTSKPLLKALPSHLPPQGPYSRSDETHPSPGDVPPNSDFRRFYLSRVSEPQVDTFVPPPLISISPFVPTSLVRLLMRGKKNSALGVKYRNEDQITNMEGAMHTFVTPVIGRCEMMGDYKWGPGHDIEEFGTEVSVKTQNHVLKSRSVALSASIQPDFELPQVMLAVAKLDAKEVIGNDLSEGVTSELIWKPPSTQYKSNAKNRVDYERSLREHMVFHLTISRRLPARKNVEDPMTVNEAIRFLSNLINKEADVQKQLIGKFMETENDIVVSLELLYNTAIQQVINEFSALEALFPQGYVYTYDPAVIFAHEIGSSIINRLFLAAIKFVSNNNHFKNMRTFAINDFADRDLVGLLDLALSAQDSYGGKTIRRCAKSELFKGNGGLYGEEESGAMLVIHNNSDGFGQNIETEGMGGSLDGAIGASSSAAASLERRRPDLLDFIF